MLRTFLSFSILCLFFLTAPLEGHALERGWQYGAAMKSGIRDHAAVVLPDGRVLICGGQESAQASYGTWIFDPWDGAYEVTGRMINRRARHAAVLLADGRVLISGGTDGLGATLSSVELYNPATGECRSAAPMHFPRAGHRMLLMPDNRVLVIGGRGAAMEVYDPLKKRFLSLAKQPGMDNGMAAGELPDGKVLILSAGNRQSFLFDYAKNKLQPGVMTGQAYARPHLLALRSGDILVSGEAGCELYDSRQQRFGPIAGSAALGAGYTATEMPDGCVWLVGGRLKKDRMDVHLVDPQARKMVSGPPMQSARSGHTAVVLPNGRLFVYGGGEALRPEMFVPQHGSFQDFGKLKIPCNTHSTTVLPDQTLLILGGYNGQYLDRAEIFDPRKGLSRVAARMGTPRHSHSATLLPDGQVLVAGGYSNGQYLRSAELYDFRRATFRMVPEMVCAREKHTATLLHDGRVLLAGGFNCRHLKSTEIYDPTAEHFQKTAAMYHAREKHCAVRLPDNRVLICGGFDGKNFLNSAEIYNPMNNTMARTGDMSCARRIHTATLLASGKVLITGGINESGFLKSAELYDPRLDRFIACGDMAQPRSGHGATLLPNGDVLITGGGVEIAEIYCPELEAFFPVGKIRQMRREHTSTLLPDGEVLLIGGEDGKAYLDQIEQYSPVYPGTTGPVLEQVPGTIFPNASFELHGRGFCNLSQPLGCQPRVVLLGLDSGAIGSYGYPGWLADLTESAYPLDLRTVETRLRITIPANLGQGYYQVMVFGQGRFSESQITVYNRQAKVAGLANPRLQPTGTPTVTPLATEGWRDEFEGRPGAKPMNWTDESDDQDFNAFVTFAPVRGKAFMRRNHESTWGKIRSRIIRCDVTKYNHIEAKVDHVAPGVRWNIALREHGTSRYWDLIPGTTDVGTYSADFAAQTGWQGVKSFYIQLNMEGSVDQSIEIDYVRVYGYKTGE